MKKYLVIALLFAGSIGFYSFKDAEKQKVNFTVDSDGSGDFTKIQDAINAVPNFRKKTTVIFIKNGIYKEKLLLPSTKSNVLFLGESTDKTILSYNDYSSKKNIFGENIGTSGSSGFFIFGDDFTARNITFRNTSGNIGQAVSVRVFGDRIRFFNCKFLGYQDTLYPRGEQSRQYYNNCYIEGAVDFIFGWSTAVFDSCSIFCNGKGYITAASTNETTNFGFVFRNCKISGSAEKNSVFLGRPWRPYSSVVYLSCEMSNIIKSEGWNNWGKEENEKTARYAEYKSTGEGANPHKRVSWSKQLSDKEAAEYTLENIFKDWDPWEEKE